MKKQLNRAFSILSVLLLLSFNTVPVFAQNGSTGTPDGTRTSTGRPDPNVCHDANVANVELCAIYGDHPIYQDNQACENKPAAATSPNNGGNPGGAIDNTGLNNGEIPDDKLADMTTIPNITVTGSKRIRKEIVPQLTKLAADYKAKFNKNLNVFSGYRTKAEQQQSIDASKASGNPNASAPVGQSSHGWGLAVDLEDGVLHGVDKNQAFNSENYKWLASEGVKQGWKNPYHKDHGGVTDEEPWHWEWGTTSSYGAGTGGTPVGPAGTQGINAAVLAETTDPNKPADGAAAATGTSIKEKIAQMLLARVDTVAQADKAAAANIGGVYVREASPGHPGEMFNKEKISAMKGKFKTQPIVSTDGEGGKVDALGSSGLGPATPSAKDMGAKSDQEIEKYGKDMATKLKDIGLTMDFAPVLDLDGPSSVIGGIGRGFSGDPAAVVTKAGAFAKGLEAGGLTPVFKHFPGHGFASGDSHIQAVTTPPLDQMKAKDLKPYETFGTSAKAIMMGHLDVPGLTKPGEPASISKEAIDLLRNDYKFKGVVMTDDITGMKAITDLGLNNNQAFEKAIMAGEDMLLVNANIDLDASINYLDQQATANPALKARIEESAGRIQALKTGISNKPAAGGAACSCGSSSGGNTPLVGGDNPEKIFNFFAGKFPGKPWIGAGFMGNMQNESGLNPRALEPGTTGDAPIRGRGYGLIQWTFEARQKPLEELAASSGRPVSDLGLQLDYIMYELEHDQGTHWKGLKGQLEGITEEGDAGAEKATKLIEDHYEVHAGGPQPTRVEAAKGYLAKYGNGGGTTSSSPSGGTTCSGGGSGQNVGGWSLPHDKAIFDKNQALLNGPHHGNPNDPAIDIPVPRGTATYSMTAGKVIKAPNEGGYGLGVTVDYGNGIQFIYGHGIDGGSLDGAKVGDAVEPGDLLMHVDDTGQSQGDHLHISITVNGKEVCPQPLLKAIYAGSNIPDPATLPSTACTTS